MSSLEQDLELFNRMTAGTLWKFPNFPPSCGDAYVLITDNTEQSRPALISFVDNQGVLKVGTMRVSVPFSMPETYLPVSTEEAREALSEFRKYLEERTRILSRELEASYVELAIVTQTEEDYGTL